MNNINLLPHQKEVIEKSTQFNRVAYYLDMGLGKTFVGSYKMEQIGNKLNLLVCQKSKISDWMEHFKTFHPTYQVIDGTAKTINFITDRPSVIVVNYDLLHRRKWVNTMDNFTFTLMLDESSMIKNERTKRAKTILKLNPSAVILLSGTPTGGKYEELYSQLQLLGWNISKNTFLDQYTKWRLMDFGGFKFKQIYGYKNIDRLNQKLREYGAVFMKTEEVIDLPKQNFIQIKVDKTKEYKEFVKESIVRVKGYGEYHEVDYDRGPIVEKYIDLVADNSLTKLLYARQLCGQYNKDKLKAFEDLVNSSRDRFIVFYNFEAELDDMKAIVDKYIKRPYSVINGSVKDLQNYAKCDNSITFVQYQAGAMGLNLQKANKIIYFTPTLSSELYEQSKKRIHRIGQDSPCFYYQLICKNSVEERIYKALAMRKDYTDALFKEEVDDD